MENQAFWKKPISWSIAIFLLFLVIGELGIVYYYFADGGGLDANGKPFSPGYSEYVASIMTSSSPIGQYPYGDHQWTLAEGATYVSQAYFRAFSTAFVVSLVYVTSVTLLTVLLWQLFTPKTSRLKP